MIAILAAAALAAPVLCTDPRAIDGDNVSCRVAGFEHQRVNVRLLGIDAPELPGHCRRGRSCAPGDPLAAKRNLARGLTLGPVTFRTLHYDRYGRPDAVVTAGTTNLSCWQLARRAAIYVKRYDQGSHIARACGK